VDQLGALGLGRQVACLGAVLAEQHRHVFAHRLGKAGRGNADEGGAILAADVVERGVEVFAPAEDGGVFGEIGGSDVHRLAEV
jgi:hypothetical protein